MKEIELSLIPSPGAKAEFLAKVKPLSPSPVVAKLWVTLPDRLILEGYTRDGWAWKPSSVQLDCTVMSTDGRQKLPGFLDYLKQRTKASFARFGSSGVMTVSYVQSSPKTQMVVRLCPDCTQIKECPIKPTRAAAAAAGNSTIEATGKTKTAAPPSRKGGSGGGLLGRLVAAQKRTNENVAKSLARPGVVAKHPTAAGAAAATSSAAAVVQQLRTAQQVLQDFREQCHKTMLDFDLAEDETTLKVPITMKDHTAGLPESEATMVTMEILKYMVYEAAEEVNEEWIAHKEPSDFIDDVVIVVYKEGAAPPEVLEEINKGELPMEVIGQQKAMQDERAKQAAQASARQKMQMEQKAHQEMDADDDDLEVLNTNKRDRRTIEDFERERQQGNAKRGKTE
jgi:hypothetical protein